MINSHGQIKLVHLMVTTKDFSSVFTPLTESVARNTNTTVFSGGPHPLRCRFLRSKLEI